MLGLFKILGLICLVLSFSAFGFLKALSLKKREEQLNSVALGIESLIRRIDCSAQELGVLLPDCFSACRFLEIDGNRVFCKTVDLTAEDKRVIDEFFGGLGQSGAQSEIGRAKVYKGIIEERAREAHNQSLQKSRIWQTFGVSLGTAAAILLI